MENLGANGHYNGMYRVVQGTIIDDILFDLQTTILGLAYPWVGKFMFLKSTYLPDPV